MLKDFLDKKQCFKLVCGAGNEDANEVEKLVLIYSKAGCMFFDLCAKPEIIDAAKRGLEKAGIQNDRYLCVSVGIDGDPHIVKASINKDKCINCKQCIETCFHGAIIENNNTCEINKIRCLGCSQCAKKCPVNAIELTSQLQNYDEVLPKLVGKGIDCIEFHAISEDEDDVEQKWQQILDNYDGMLCISIDRSALGDKKLISRVRKLLSKREPYTTIIQADGIAMSGNSDEYSTTLQAVATAQLFQNENIPAYIMMSGGTNTKSTELAKLCGVKPHCVAVGSYARKIVNEYIEREDFFENPEIINKAVKTAKNLIDTTLRYMGD